MKILIVCDTFPPEFAPRMGYLCKYLKRMGCMADVVCEQYSEDTRFDFLADSAHKVKRVRFYRSLSLPKPRLEWGAWAFRDLFFHAKDKKLVREIQRDTAFTGYDLVLCSTYRTFPLRTAAILAKHFHVPLVADLRDIVEQYPDRSYLTHRLPFASLVTRQLLKERNRVLRRAAAVVSVSEWHSEFLKRFNPNTHLIYNGYDPELFFPEHRADPYFRIVFTGRMISVENRNPEWLFKAVSHLLRAGKIDKSDFRLCWYTDEKTRQYIQNESEKYGIGDISECRGFVSAPQIPALLNGASVLLQLANVADTQGPKGIMTTKFFEALAVGKPLLLVRSDESCLEALVNRYHCGLAARQEKEIEAFIEEQYALWRKNGHTEIPVDPDIERRFSRERQAEAFLALFRDCIVKRAFPNPTGALFLQEWWWRALCPEKDMRLLQTEENGRLTGFWPLARRKRLGGLCRVYAAPVLTQHTGPWVLERKYLKELLLQIPSKAMLCVNVGWDLTEEERALCRERGMECRNRVTHRIEDVSDLEKVWAGMTPARQRQIKKGLKYLHRVENPSVEMLLELQQETFGRRKLSLPYSPTTVRRLYNAVKEHGAGELVALADAGNRIMACGLFVYDNKACYSLMHGFRKTEKDWGAGSLLQWEGIRTASSRGLVFDFEGSNIETIARFNLSFGAKPFTYTCIERYRTLFRLLRGIK